MPHRPFDSRRIGLSANRVQFVGNPEVVAKSRDRSWQPRLPDKLGLVPTCTQILASYRRQTAIASLFLRTANKRTRTHLINGLMA